jgi:hypothetical protein
VSATGDITKVKRLLDIASQYSNFIGIVNAHESFWTCDISFDEMAGLKDKLKAYALSKGRSIKVWNYIDNLYDKSMLPDNQIERIMDVAVTWQHCAGNVEGTCNTASPTSALNMILNDRNRISSSGAKVELVFLMQTFTTNGYSKKFTLNQLQDYSCQFLDTSALDGFGFYTWHAGWWSDLHSWPELQPAIPYIYNSCTNVPHGLTPPKISGNVGAAGVILSYTDDTSKVVTSQSDGSYSLQVNSGWSGTITPSNVCYTFNPASLSFSNVTADQINQNFAATFNSISGCVKVDIEIDNGLMGTHGVAPTSTLRLNYPSVINGPVKVASADGSSIFTSQRVTSGDSYNELLGLPANQFTTEYWFPYYDHGYPSVSGSNMRTWILVGNPSTSQTATVNISIGGNLMSGSPFSIAPGSRVTPRWLGVQGGPVRVVSTNGVNIFASERVFTSNSNAFNESLGVASTDFTSEYWFPWYDNVNMQTSIVVGNTSASQAANVDIYVGGVLKDSLSIPTNSTLFRFYGSLVSGPVRVVSTNGVNIVTSENAVSGPNNSFSDVLGMPANQFTTEYWFPYYDHGYPSVSGSNMRTWILVGNPSTSQTATVNIYIGGALMSGSPFSVGPGNNITPRWIGVQGGPVRVVSDIPIFTSERVFTAPNSSFNEMLGCAFNQLTTEYWYPWYDSTNMTNDILVSSP